MSSCVLGLVDVGSRLEVMDADLGNILERNIWLVSSSHWDAAHRMTSYFLAFSK